jgi:hypothetical protein
MSRNQIIVFFCLARSITNTSALYIANFLTFKYCTFPDISSLKKTTNNNSITDAFNMNMNETIFELNNTYCSKDYEIKNCKTNGGICETHFDPFYVEGFIFFLFSLFWLLFFRKQLDRLESLPKSEWTVYQDKIKLKKVD